MRVHLHPQRRTVEVAGRRSVGRLLAELGVLPNTAMVIRGDELLTDGEMVEDADEIEVRAVISGGAGVPWEARRSRAERTSEHGRASGRAHGLDPRVPAREPAST
jgi:sulfur carrier protein